jgi:hypothetical protein
MFVRNNLKTTEVFLDKREALAKACVVAEFNVSEGTLPPIETTASGGRLVTSLQLSEGFSIDETTTLGEVSCRLVGCNASLRYGDKISVLYMMQVSPDEEFGSNMPHTHLKLYEFILEDNSRIPFYTLVDERLFRSLDGRVCTDERVGEGAVGYVHSRKTKRAVQYSTQSLALLPGTVLCKDYGSLKKSDKAAASYEPRSRRGKGCLTPTFGTTANGTTARVGATLAVAPTPTMPQQQGKARLDPTFRATARVAPTPTTKKKNKKIRGKP